MDDSWYQIIFAAVVGVPAAVLAFILEPRRAKREPNTRPYTWGLFQGLTGIGAALVFSVIALLTVILAPAESATSLGLALLIIVLYGVPGYFVLKRKRWAWVLLTVASLNPILWIANGIYGKNRWDEFDGKSPVVAEEPH